MWKNGKEKGISIGKYSKLGIDATASDLFHLENIDEISTLLAHQNSLGLPIQVIGDGSNTVCAGTHVEKLIVKNNLSGVATTEAGDDVLVTAAAGENWDDLVVRTIRNGWSGLAALSAIPGSVGAAPIQNIGAYGAEVADVIETVFVYDLQKDQRRTLTNKQCQFSYRWSIFKDHPRRFIVLSVTFRLSTDPPEVPSYGTIEDRLTALGNGQPTLAEIREVITNIRWNKLPRPDETPNVGSFFHNPVVSES
jgi:UDP-N-acetylmuramate dehydrogenase